MLERGVGRGRARKQSVAWGSRTTVRVLCVDDHALLLEGLSTQFNLDGGVEMAGRLASADNLQQEVERIRPDVVVLDIEMPGADVFEMTDRLASADQMPPFVFLSAHIRDGYLAAAYKCGAAGYFAKSDDLREIVAGVKSVARRRGDAFVMGSKVRAHCSRNPALPRSLQRAQDERPTVPLATLTAREMEVLRLIGRGLARNEIAHELCRSVKTIDGHQDRIMHKLGLQTRAELMLYAIREGLVEA